MGKLSLIGRIFYGLAVVETGVQTIYYHDFPYWLIPPKHGWIPGISAIAYVSGALLVAAGACIVLQRRAREAGLMLGGLLLLVFCFAHLPDLPQSFLLQILVKSLSSLSQKSGKPLRNHLAALRRAPIR